MSLYDEALALLPEMITHRRTLHQHAEGMDDMRFTLAYIADRLERYGIHPVSTLAGGLVADIGQGDGGMLLRADIDALPMQEDNDLHFKSITNFAHNCGHDLHVAMLLEAAHLLKLHEAELPARVRLLFQPDEERATGARAMVDAGAIDAGIRAAYALHVMPTLPSGQLYYYSGNMYASSDTLEINVYGKSAHGAAPQSSNDPIFSAVQIYNTIQGLLTRACPPSEMALISICTMHGGDTFNVIPNHVTMGGTMRTYDENLRHFLKSRLSEIVPQTAAVFNTRADIHFPSGTPSVYCDPDLQRLLLPAINDALPQHRILQQKQPFTWSEDFGIFREQVPVSMMTLGAQLNTFEYPIHDTKVHFNEDAMPVGAAALAAVGMQKIGD